MQSGTVGHGEPVLVIPGLMSGDGSTSFLRRSLDAAGFVSSGLGGGYNARVTQESLAMVERQLDRVASASRQPVMVVGWSLGGLYARALAHRHPEKISLVVTLGTPFSGDRHANNAWRVYEFVNDHTVENPPFKEDLSIKPPVHTIAVWSPVDGVIAPECACGQSDESDEQVELPVTHLEMGSSRRAVGGIIDILARRSAGTG
ncbi:esterase/lipase family protein [Pontixanthobacter aquaemixtae]|uniref:Alpha/beta fold hydrolase n=1 Tax=Pontixanthobacter aquaemixtae TaxID=1958940 RepID=A0A844ZRA3_9SPHN|nr:alpha/beta fold hydrolase [Pontixanthobacter aquaemixtae]MXO90363.1 alpha/beta fold hydrolase [Pontixanthobacter aquaemixtae]